jgi:hypothetical protein
VTEPPLPGGHRAELSAIEVVPQAVADEIIAEARATIRVLERELNEVQQAAPSEGERIDVAADFLVEQAEALIDEAQAYRAKVMEAARAEAASIIRGIPAPANGQGPAQHEH